MSREAYQPPTLIPQPAARDASGFNDTSRPVTYRCGDCDSKVSLRRQDPIRCKECGHRVLYKERTNRCDDPCCYDPTWHARPSSRQLRLANEH